MRICTSPEGFRDWPELVQLIRDAFATMEGRIDPASSLTLMGIDAFKAKAEKEVLLLAYDGLQLIGCAYADLREDCVYLGKVAVAEAARGKGVARGLFAAAEDLAQAHGKPALELQTRVELVENHAIFGALGFVPVAETAHPGYSRPTSITMRRAVSPVIFASPAIRFELLSQRRDLSPMVATWLADEWPDWYGIEGPGKLMEDVAAFGASPVLLPIGVVAFWQDRPVGFAALKEASIPSHCHLTPWAAAGFVLPGFRGRGVGARLLKHLVALASSLGYRAVYCGTSTAASLMERVGWTLEASVLHEGKPLGIYRSRP